MSERHLFMLSPYRLPTNHQISLNDEEMASWLNGMVCLWHPALIWGAKEPPKVDSSYDHEMPLAGQVFAVPSAPPLFQPDDWVYRVQNAGAIRFEAAAEREDTLANIKKAVHDALAGDSAEAKQAFGSPDLQALLELPPEKVRPFLGLGLGYLMVESLFDAMDHEHLLAVEEFWGEVQKAIAALLRPDGDEEVQQALREAAGRLLAAREVLYAIAVHVLDIAMVDAKKLDAPLPAAFERGFPLNLLATGQALEKLAAEQPERLQALKDRLNPELQPPKLEIAGGVYREREDALLPIESQLWNLRRGKAVAKDLFGVEVQVYGRKRTAFHPHTPLFLSAAGLRHALLLNFDNAVIPNHRATVVNWASPDGRSLDAFTRAPLKVHQAQTFFNLVYSLHQSISQDTAPTLALLHEGEPPFALYDDWLALTALAPVLGDWTTFGRYFGDALAGEYAGAASPDDFFSDYLEERVNDHRCDPVSAFPRQARQRRRVDAAWALAAVQRALSAPTDAEHEALRRLGEAENALETEGLDVAPGSPNPAATEVAKIEQEFAEKVAARLQARAADNQPGYLLLNPCAFARRVALELDPAAAPFAVEAPIKAAQFDADKLRVVVEVPPLGFAWLPRNGKPGAPPPKPRLRLAEDNMVRNEFFEAEIDPATGGLRAIRDLRTRIPRIAQQLVYNPGSKMEARSVKATINGAALGEVVSEGVILDEQNQQLATFRQRFRAWLSRPLLDIRIEIEPTHAPTGYPWHSYYGARFAWKDDRATLMRGVNGISNQTNHTRPVSPDFLEVRSGKQNTLIFPGGLPFHQRHGSRMVDLILIPEGETTHVFDIGLALDRENHLQTALGFISPLAIVPTTKGPPHIGPSGWLFHVDAPNLVLIGLKPCAAADNVRRLQATFLESSGYGGSAELRCVRDPTGAYVLDGEDTPSTELPLNGDAVRIDFSASDLQRIQIDFA
jgi:hypothetical protein